MPIALSVNLNKIALLRNAREGNYPDVLAFGKLCLDLSVKGLTVHPRPDQRHIRASDIRPLSDLIARYPNAEFNIEGNPFAGPNGDYPGYMSLVESVRPTQCTLVPDSTQQLTSDHGFDLTRQGDNLRPIIADLKKLDTRISLFMDPDLKQIQLAKDLGADRIELYTGPYAEAFARDPQTAESVYEQYKQAATFAHEIGLGVNAGHDLNLLNLPTFRELPHLAEVSIGHALTIDALTLGFESAVKSYLALLLPHA